MASMVRSKQDGETIALTADHERGSSEAITRLIELCNGAKWAHVQEMRRRKEEKTGGSVRPNFGVASRPARLASCRRSIAWRGCDIRCQVGSAYLAVCSRRKSAKGRRL